MLQSLKEQNTTAAASSTEKTIILSTTAEGRILPARALRVDDPITSAARRWRAPQQRAEKNEGRSTSKKGTATVSGVRFSDTVKVYRYYYSPCISSSRGGSARCDDCDDCDACDAAIDCGGDDSGESGGAAPLSATWYGRGDVESFRADVRDTVLVMTGRGGPPAGAGAAAAASRLCTRGLEHLRSKDVFSRHHRDIRSSRDAVFGEMKRQREARLRGIGISGGHGWDADTIRRLYVAQTLRFRDAARIAAEMDAAYVNRCVKPTATMTTATATMIRPVRHHLTMDRLARVEECALNDGDDDDDTDAVDNRARRNDLRECEAESVGPAASARVQPLRPPPHLPFPPGQSPRRSLISIIQDVQRISPSHPSYSPSAADEAPTSRLAAAEDATTTERVAAATAATTTAAAEAFVAAEPTTQFCDRGGNVNEGGVFNGDCGNDDDSSGVTIENSSASGSERRTGAREGLEWMDRLWIWRLSSRRILLNKREDDGGV